MLLCSVLVAVVTDQYSGHEQHGPNAFLQTWKVNERAKLPQGLKDMLKTGREWKVSFESVKLSQETKERLPAWYHVGATGRMRWMNNTSLSKCLRNNHGIQTIEDLLKVSRRPRSMGMLRHRRKNCRCTDCREDRNAEGCRAPYLCVEAAERILNQIQEKWDPRMITVDDNLSLSKEQCRHNQTHCRQQERPPSTHL